jgi:N-acetylglucosamine-6-phosphate deacetylase
VKIIITGGIILTPRQEYKGHSLVLSDDKITAIVPDSVAVKETDAEVIDAKGMWVTPGLIDIHTHGADGFDTMDATPEALQGFGRFLSRHGITSFFPTTITASKDQIQAAIDNITQIDTDITGARIRGIHLEGPYLNPDHKGAQPEDQLRSADPAEYGPWIAHDRVKLITVAPEIDGVLTMIEAGQARGVEFAVGHSGASYDMVRQAADRGLRQATHTFNGMLGLHHRRPGTVGGVLTDERIYAQVIADGVHLHPAIVKLILKVKGVEKTILISDSMRATGLEDGAYDLGGQTVIVEAGIARIPSGSLAGSTLTLDAAVRNTMQFASLSFQEVLPTATSVPAQAMGLQDQIGVLAPGAQADVVCFDADLKPCMVFIDGELRVSQ